MKFNILVADDEKNIREGLGEFLKLEGYTVSLAADGLEGAKAIDRGDMDLLISDLRMPGMTGTELLRHVVSRYPTVPVILLTGHGTVEDAVEAMRNGAYDFITKPVNLDHLSLLVKRALERRDCHDKTVNYC